jgi:Uncharacterized protein conserved in bacteria
MKISNRTLAIIFTALILISVVWIAAKQIRGRDEMIAEIRVEGKLLYTFDLNQVKESYTIELPHNTILVEHGQISMESADCPDHLCVKQGKISSSAFPIICLPNKVEIKIVGKTSYDAVSGR